MSGVTLYFALRLQRQRIISVYYRKLFKRRGRDGVRPPTVKTHTAARGKEMIKAAKEKVGILRVWPSFPSLTLDIFHERVEIFCLVTLVLLTPALLSRKCNNIHIRSVLRVCALTAVPGRAPLSDILIRTAWSSLHCSCLKP